MTEYTKWAAETPMQAAEQPGDQVADTDGLARTHTTDLGAGLRLSGPSGVLAGANLLAPVLDALAPGSWRAVDWSVFDQFYPVNRPPTHPGAREPLSAGWHHLPDVTAPDRSFPIRALRFGVP